MTEKEFNLSEKIESKHSVLASIRIKYIKEFIKLLKRILRRNLTLRLQLEEIDKLAGDKF